MKLDLAAVEKRMTELVEECLWDLTEPGAGCGEPSDDWHDDEEEVIASAGKLQGEEKLFYLLLATHFNSARTAGEFYSILNWKRLLASSTLDLRRICTRFFHGPHSIGDHRRYFRCLDGAKKIDYTLEILQSYKQVVQSEPYGSQACFFEVDGHPRFEVLYKRMFNIKHFHRRLPRFDHLERLARTHDFYFRPARFFADEDEGGPRDGVTYVVVGKRLRKEKRKVTKYLVGKFTGEWNVAVGPKYRIPQAPTLGEVLRSLELWIIDQVRKRLPIKSRNAPGYVFDLESCLCNWQKGK
jgi:hypothetical protein